MAKADIFYGLGNPIGIDTPFHQSQPFVISIHIIISDLDIRMGI